jgi:hypothetical protein
VLKKSHVNKLFSKINVNNTLKKCLGDVLRPYRNMVV